MIIGLDKMLPKGTTPIEAELVEMAPTEAGPVVEKDRNDQDIDMTREEKDVNPDMQRESEEQVSAGLDMEKMGNLDTLIQNNITKLIVTNGSTGEKKEVQDAEQINSILSQIKELDIVAQEKVDRTGYLYFLALYRDENLVQIVYVNNDTVVIAGTMYTVESSQNIIDSIK